MELLEEVADDVMIAAFVQAEFDSARFREPYRQGVRSFGVGRGGLIDHPDTANAVANGRRRALLRAVRGYGAGQYLFRGWPADVRWWRACVALAELAKLRYAHYQTWVDLTKGTRLIGDGAANVDTVPVGENANANIKAVARAVTSGVRYPALIFVAQSVEGPLVLVEGHTRATAYVLAGIPDPVDILVGISADMASWFYWEQA